MMIDFSLRWIDMSREEIMFSLFEADLLFPIFCQIEKLRADLQTGRLGGVLVYFELKLLILDDK
jgi:hypothetical protein